MSEQDSEPWPTQSLCSSCSAALGLLISQARPGGSLTQISYRVHSHCSLEPMTQYFSYAATVVNSTSAQWIGRCDCPPSSADLPWTFTSGRPLSPLPQSVPQATRQHPRLPGLIGKWLQVLSHDSNSYLLFLGNTKCFLSKLRKLYEEYYRQMSHSNKIPESYP